MLWAWSQDAAWDVRAYPSSLWGTLVTGTQPANLAGAVTLGEMTATGSLAALLSIAGAVTLGPLTASGTSTVSTSAFLTGAVTLDAMTASGLAKTGPRAVQPIHRRPTAWFDRRRRFRA